MGIPDHLTCLLRNLSAGQEATEPDTKQQTGKFLKEMGIPDHLTCLLRNLYAGQGATVRTGHGTIGNREKIMSRLYIVTLLIQLI